MSLGAGDVEEIKQGRRTEKPILPNQWPALLLGHVIEHRAILKQLIQLGFFHYDRLSMMLRQMKFAEIRLSGTRPKAHFVFDYK
jgi:hypothetical protein